MKKIEFGVIIASLGFVFGVLFAPLFGVGFPGLSFFISGSVFFSIFRRRRFAWVLLFISFSCLAIWRYQLWQEDSLASYNGQKVEMVGTVCAEPDRRGASQKIVLCFSQGKVLASTQLYPEYFYGDRLRLTGKLQAPEPIEDFRYDYYLARSGIYSLSYQPRLEKVGEGEGWNNVFFASLFRFKRKLFDIISRGLPEPEAGLAQALILGYKRTVSDANLEKFSIIGISHVIAISGTHITILSALAMKFLLSLKLRPRPAFYLAAIFLFLYVLLTGWQASAVRSLIMGLMALWTASFKKNSRIELALVLSAALMLLANPRLLRDDLGFQLSFLAMLALIYICPLGDYYLDKWFKGKKVKSLLSALNVTLAAQLVTAPVSLINFGRFSLIAPLSNVLILWTFAPLMALLLGALFLSGIIPFLSWFWFWPAYCLLRYQFLLTDILAQFPGAAWENSAWTWFEGWVYYLVLFLLVFVLYRFWFRPRKNSD